MYQDDQRKSGFLDINEILKFYLANEALKIQNKIFLLENWSILAIHLVYLIENSLYIIFDDTQRHLTANGELSKHKNDVLWF